MAPTGQKGWLITVTYKQGHDVLQLLGKAIKEKWNDELKFSANERSTIDRNNIHLFKAIKKVSSGFHARPKMITLFGDHQNGWKERPKRMIPIGGGKEIVAPGQPEEPLYDIVDETATVELDLNSYARDAMATILLRLTHPDSEDHISSIDQESVVWPLAEKLNCVSWLEKKIGLGKVKSDIFYGADDGSVTTKLDPAAPPPGTFPDHKPLPGLTLAEHEEAARERR